MRQRRARLTKVSVANDGTLLAPGDASHGGGEVPAKGDAVSADGTRVAFMNDTANGQNIYLRTNIGQEQSKVEGTGASERCTEPGRACTVEVSASQRTTGPPEPEQQALLWGASADDSKVFFTSCAKLTDDSTAVVPSGGCTPSLMLASGKPYRQRSVRVRPAER